MTYKLEGNDSTRDGIGADVIYGERGMDTVLGAVALEDIIVYSPQP